MNPQKKLNELIVIHENICRNCKSQTCSECTEFNQLKQQIEKVLEKNAK